MELTANNFYVTLDQFKVLSNQIHIIDEAAFKHVFGSEDAGLKKNILYILRTQKPISRLKGESDVLYIGQTKGTLKQRYLIHSGKLANSKANRMKFEHTISQYGPIRVTFAPFNQFGATLKDAEGQLLWWYFQNHCEYPPINYTQTKCRNCSIQI